MIVGDILQYNDDLFSSFPYPFFSLHQWYLQHILCRSLAKIQLISAEESRIHPIGSTRSNIDMITSWGNLGWKLSCTILSWGPSITKTLGEFLLEYLSGQLIRKWDAGSGKNFAPCSISCLHVYMLALVKVLVVLYLPIMRVGRWAIYYYSASL